MRLSIEKMVTPSICSNSVYLQVCNLISVPTNWLSFHSYQQNTGDDNARNADSGVVLVETAYMLLCHYLSHSYSI